MLNNSLKRESIKAVGASGALIAGGPVAASLVIVLGVAVEALGLLGEKRTKELFASERFVEKVVAKVEQSDDFASFVFSIWQKHNLESSEERRRLLKNFLKREVDNVNNQFENFSKIEFIIQNANLAALKLLAIIHSDVVQKRKTDPGNAADRLLNLTTLIPLVQSATTMHEQDIEYFMSELGSLGLVSILQGRLNGPFYIETKLGFILLDYIRYE